MLKCWWCEIDLTSKIFFSWIGHRGHNFIYCVQCYQSEQHMPSGTICDECYKVITGKPHHVRVTRGNGNVYVLCSEKCWENSRDMEYV
jgi:hypothetical protein